MCPSRHVELVHGLLRRNAVPCFPLVMPEKVRTALDVALEAYILDFAFVADTVGIVPVVAEGVAPAPPSRSQPVARQSGSLSGDHCNWIVMTCDSAERATGQVAKQVMLHQEHPLQLHRQHCSCLFLG